MSSRASLDLARAEERDAVLAEIRERLSATPTLVAAYLFGSVTQATADALSDLDLWIIAVDAWRPVVFAARESLVQDFDARSTIVFNGCADTPQDGIIAQIMVLYEGRNGPYLIDWLLQGQSKARLPIGAIPLFDRVGIAPQQPEFAGRGDSPTDLKCFWWLSVRIAKQLARGQIGEATANLQVLNAMFDAALPGADGVSTAITSSPLPSGAHEQLALLASMATTMDKVLERHTLPLLRVDIGLVLGFFDLVRRYIHADGGDELSDLDATIGDGHS